MLLDRQSRGHVNCFRTNIGNTDAHEDAKYRLYRSLRRQDHLVVVEAVFEDDSGRADLVDLDRGVAWEILDSESKKSIEMKKLKYPIPIYTIQCHTKSKR